MYLPQANNEVNTLKAEKKIKYKGTAGIPWKNMEDGVWKGSSHQHPMPLLKNLSLSLRLPSSLSPSHLVSPVTDTYGLPGSEMSKEKLKSSL